MPRRLVAVCAALSFAACSRDHRQQTYWTRQIGTVDHDYGESVATDAAGNVLLAGTTYGYLDPMTPDPQWGGSPHAFVGKYGAGGEIRWIWQAEDAWVGTGLAVATDRAGNVLLAGIVAIPGVTECQDGFVMKFDAAGALQWTRVFGTPWCDELDAVATDAAGNVLVAGQTNGIGTVDQPPGGGDGFVVKYDADGTELWTRAIGGGWAYAVAADADGNVLAAGSTYFGLEGVATAGDFDAFVVKFDGDGGRQWTRQLGSVGPEYGESVATDAAGNVFLAGATTGGLDGLPAPEWGWDPFLVKYGPDGTRQWTRMRGTWFFDKGRAVATDAAGNAFLAGVQRGSLDPYDGITTTRGDLTAFVVKYDPDGAELWSAEIGHTHQEGNAAATDALGNVFVAGTTFEGFDGNRSLGYYDAFVASHDPAGHKR